MRWVSNLVGGWEVDGIITLATGLPFTVTLNSGVNFGAPSWPNRIASGTLPNPQPNHWFNTAAFVAPPPNTYGNSARGVLYGPGTSNLGPFCAAQFPSEGAPQHEVPPRCLQRLQHPEFRRPNAAIGSPTAGVITGTLK